MNLQSYIDLGWSVFPVKGPIYGKDYQDSKTPLVDWIAFQKLKPTPELVAKWIGEKPKMSVGIVTGRLNGFFVIDIDGNDWVEKLPNADFGLTWKSTSKRGCHFFYKWESWMDAYPTTKSAVGGIKGFDIRGEGGYVVAPNGNESVRKWQVSYTEPLAIMPDWLRKFLQDNLIPKQKSSAAVVINDITEGNRHTSFLSLVGKLHNGGMRAADIIQILSPLAVSSGFVSELEPLVLDVVNRYAKDRRPELKPESIRALLSEPEPPLAWLIEGLWTDRSRGFIAGHPGVGKTWIALDMLISVVTGQLCLSKYRPAYKAPCLLIEEEASRLNLARRIHSMARARGIMPDDLASLHHITRQFAKIPDDANQLVDIIKSLGVKFVVFDSLRRFHSGNENSSNEMQVVLDAFAKIGHEADCSVLLIHHLSKSSVENAGKPIFERMRGSSDFWAWRDCIIGVEGEEDADTATCSFQFRDAEAVPSVQVKRFVGATTGAVALEAVSMEESEEFLEKSGEVLGYVKSQIAGANRTQICKAVGGRKAAVVTIIKKLEKFGKLVKEGPNLVVPV